MKSLLASPIGSPNLLPTYTLLSVWGDSRTAQNWSFSNAIPFPQTCGQYWWLEAVSQSVRLDVRYNFGVSGDRIDQLYYRMVHDIPNSYGIRPSKVPPSVAGLLIGTNTLNGAAAEGITDSELQKQLRNCVDWLRKRGHYVIVTAETPRGGTSGNTLSAADLPYMLKYRDYCTTLAQLENVAVVNPWHQVSDASRTDGRPQEGFLNTDDLHFSGAMGFTLGSEMAALEVIQSLPKFNFAPASNADQYSASSYPKGCLNLNPMLVQGTGGTLGSNAAGLAPQNYTLSTNDAGITVTGSFVTTTYKGRPRPAFRMVISGTTTAENSYAGLRQTGLLGTKVVAGDRVFAGFECVAAAGHTNFSSPSVMLDTGTTTTRIWGGSNISNFRGWPSQASRAFEAMPLTIEENIAIGSASLALDIRIQFAETTTLTAMTIDLISAFARRP